MAHYALFDWRVASDIPIDGLVPWTGDVDRPIDVSIIRGEVALLPEERGVHAVVQQDGSTIVVATDIGRFHVSAGRRVIADILPDVGCGIVETILLGPVLGALCYQRGVRALHSNAVLIDGKVVALAGTSGTGKSTLAALLVRRGHRPVADDVLIITHDGKATTLAHTVNRQLRLWRETLVMLGHDPESLRRSALGERDKFIIPAPAEPAPAVSPLRTMIWLSRSIDGRERLEHMTAAAVRAETVRVATYRPALAREYLARGRTNLGDLSLPGVDVWMLKRPRDLGLLEAQADMIEHLVRSPDPRVADCVRPVSADPFGAER